MNAGADHSAVKVMETAGTRPDASLHDRSHRGISTLVWTPTNANTSLFVFLLDDLKPARCPVI